MNNNTRNKFASCGLEILKRAWYGSHHHYQTAYTPLYVTERCYVYNHRNLETIFWKFINQSMRLPNKEGYDADKRDTA